MKREKSLLPRTAIFGLSERLFTRATIARDNNCKRPSVDLNILVWGWLFYIWWSERRGLRRYNLPRLFGKRIRWKIAKHWHNNHLFFWKILYVGYILFVQWTSARAAIDTTPPRAARDTTTQRLHMLPSTTPHNTKCGPLGKRLGEMGPSSSPLTNLVGAATG